MAALALPLTPANFVDLLQLQVLDANLFYQQEVSGLAGGEGIAADLAPPLWDFDCASGEFPHNDVEMWRARALALDGAIGAFLLYPRAMFPSTDPNGVLLAGASLQVNSINANRKELSLKGAPADFVFPWGAFLSIIYGSSRYALVQLLAPANANGSGVTPQAEVRPHLRPGIAVNDTISAIKPVAKVKLIPNSLRVERVGSEHSRLRFTARQTLAAN